MLLGAGFACAKLEEIAKSAVVVRHKDRTGNINSGLSVAVHSDFELIFTETRTGHGLFRKETINGMICFYCLENVFLCFNAGY
ncbi:hypothetical protein AA106556_1056 [Neokomagataea tanensis NBRC 106556]|uniref:Uncharacterized protein n=1 Tax=Neokomagataea tanensis NBRC 106556 TaxID=1223519 RepID=A0ABQ0QIQ4_9PROT|nr:hypothetical protein AA106556_1056 [Neokomagataea tanensis NBRC 106556]